MKMACVWKTWKDRAATLLGITVLFLILTACAPQNRLPEGLTPIPTLIPVTSQPGGIKPTESPSKVIESYPAGLPSAKDGQNLYDENCASCHGIDGNGVVANARNFGDVDYMRGETPANFYVVLTEGRGADMPAFGQDLTSDQRWNVVYYVWRFSTSQEILNDGSIIYADNCSACHGEDGRSLILGAANFTDHRFMANQSPSNLYVAVTQGQGSMPAWQARLSQDERWAVIDYIRTFTYDPQIEAEDTLPATETPTSEAARTECQPYIGQVNPFEWGNTDALAAGQTLFDLNCSSCHGEDGKGRLPGILDFTDPATHNDIRENPGEYVCSITEGYQRMPAFKEKLSSDEIWQLIVWIASLGD